MNFNPVAIQWLRRGSLTVLISVAGEYFSQGRVATD